MARGQTPDPIPNSAVKTLERRWYCVLRRGRVGRRQVIGTQVLGFRNQESGFRKLEVETRSLYSLLIPDSSFLTPHSSLLTPHSSLLTPESPRGGAAR